MGHIKRDDPCDLCGSEYFEIVSRRDRRREHLTTVVCVRCGLISHLQVPSDAQLSRYYAEQYRHDYHGETAPSAYRVVRAWDNGRRIFAQLEPHLRLGDEVFEIGAGIGCTVKNFSLAGYNASGIEPGRGFQKFSEKRLHTKIQRRGLAEMPTTPICDFALLIHVIEHFNQPTQALLHIHHLLRPGGRFYVECPNVAAPHAAPKKLFHYAHIYNFTHQTLTLLAQKCGFAVVERLSDERDPEVRILFAKSESQKRDIDPNSYRNTLDGLARYNALTYHLRWRYVAHRMHRFYKMYTGYLTAKKHFSQVLETCAQHEQENAGRSEATSSKRSAA